MENEKVVPTTHDLGALSDDSLTTADLIRQAEESDAADRQLKIFEAVKKYKKAVFWAAFLSTSLIMEGYDVVIITSFYAQTQFQNRFGVVDPATGNKLITPQWQSGLSNSALVGQLAGLIINGFAQDRYGCRPTFIFFMIW
jgi:MFS transporter, SP family, general alpha glucoside:H+ symporter